MFVLCFDLNAEVYGLLSAFFKEDKNFVLTPSFNLQAVYVSYLAVITFHTAFPSNYCFNSLILSIDLADRFTYDFLVDRSLLSEIQMFYDSKVGL